jgi:hypothetical protein
MMLRSLVDEVVRRRLWPIPLVAILVAIAAPVLFMKSAPTNAPASTDAPAAAPAGKPLPDQGLVEDSDRNANKAERPARKAQDPFAPPSGSSSTDSASTSAASTGTGKTSSPQSVPVVIKNSDGTTSTATITPSTSTTKSNGSTAKTKKTTKAKSTAPKTTTIPKITVPKTTTSSAASTAKITYVDVRFGERMGTMTRYRVPRLQTFRAGGNVAAMFVGYSAIRNAAVFAVAPSTRITGVTCREVKNVCRYIDLPVGAHARLTLRGADGSVISRRLDVVQVRHLPKVTGSKASARMTTLPAAKCLLNRLLALPLTASSISTDSCD